MYEDLEQRIEICQHAELVKKKIPLAFMEPYVIQSKLKRVNTKEGLNIFWKNALLLEITRKVSENSELWSIKNKEGILLDEIIIKK